MSATNASRQREIACAIIIDTSGHFLLQQRDDIVGMLRLSDLPDWDWRDISTHLKCTRCGTVGFVDTRVDWSEVINFNKGIG
jgi:hypothetical protein